MADNQQENITIKLSCTQVCDCANANSPNSTAQQRHQLLTRCLFFTLLLLLLPLYSWMNCPLMCWHRSFSMWIKHNDCVFVLASARGPTQQRRSRPLISSCTCRAATEPSSTRISYTSFSAGFGCTAAQHKAWTSSPHTLWSTTVCWRCTH